MAVQIERIEQLEQNLQVVAGSAKTVWNNQKEMNKSVGLLDEQFAVSTRMSILGLNLVMKTNGMDEQIDAGDIETLFRDWAEFRARPDFRNLMTEWMLGVPLDKMPPPTEQPAKKEGEADAEGDQWDKELEQAVAEDSATG